MALRNKEGQSGPTAAVCSGCDAEIISTDRNDLSPLCLICRAVILARHFQARRAAGPDPSKEEKRRNRRLRFIQILVDPFQRIAKGRSNSATSQS